MNQEAVAKVAETAAKIVAPIKDHRLRPVAFGVVFERLLDSAPGASMGVGRSPTVRKPKGKNDSTRKAGPHSHVLELVGDDFFSALRTLNATLEELGNRGHSGYEAYTIGKVLQRLVQDNVLRRKKVQEGKKTVYAYTNW